MSENQSPLLVEFAGVPGGGKSTLSKHVASEFDNYPGVDEPTYNLNEGLSPRIRKFAKLPYVIRGTTHSGAISQKYVRHAGWDTKWSLLYNWLFVSGVTGYAMGRNGITILDQGFVQGFWSFVISESDDIVDLYRRELFEVYPRKSTLLVLVKASRETVVSRLNERDSNQSRISPNGSSTYSVDDAFEAYKIVIETVERLVESRPEISLLTICSEDQSDLKLGVDIIKDEIRTRYDGENTVH